MAKNVCQVYALREGDYYTLRSRASERPVDNVTVNFLKSFCLNTFTTLDMIVFPRFRLDE
jgi:hypothetical protein